MARVGSLGGRYERGFTDQIAVGVLKGACLAGDGRGAGGRVVSGGLRESAEDRDSSAAENVFDDCFFEAGGVVVEVEEIAVFVEPEFLDAVGVGELPERAVLVSTERALEFVSDGHVSHVGIIAG
jgi:hypothetical protein